MAERARDRGPAQADAEARSEGAGDEPVEVVDRQGRVIDVVSRRRLRDETLRHRCTYVAVLSGPVELLDRAVGPDTPLIVHRRAAWKDTYPSFWDLAFGGVCDVGEAWERAAARELAEEAGIEGASLRDLGPVAYEDADNRVVGRVYVTAWPEPPTCTDGEVVAVSRVAIGELEAWTRSVDVCPDSVAVVLPLVQGLI